MRQFDSVGYSLRHLCRDTSGSRHPLAKPRGNLGFPDDPSAQRRRGIAPKNIAPFNTHAEAMEPWPVLSGPATMPRSQPRWVEAMKKPSRAGGKPAKARPHSALKPRGQNAPKPQSNRRSAADDSKSEVAQLKRELHEAVEQQTATAEILRVISSSPGDLQPVFEAILENATRICEAKLGNLWLREGDKFRIVAVYGGSPEYREYLFAEPLVVLDPQDATNRVVSDREVVQIDDISKAPTYGMRMRIATVKIAKARTLVGVPLLKDNEVVGIIAVYRQEVRPFTDKQIELVQNFAAQAVIAIENARLLNELRQRTAELTEVVGATDRDLRGAPGHQQLSG